MSPRHSYQTYDVERKYCCLTRGILFSFFSRTEDVYSRRGYGPRSTMFDIQGIMSEIGIVRPEAYLSSDLEVGSGTELYRLPNISRLNDEVPVKPSSREGISD